jgi:hypothetical protein
VQFINHPFRDQCDTCSHECEQPGKWRPICRADPASVGYAGDGVSAGEAYRSRNGGRFIAPNREKSQLMATSTPLPHRRR